MCKLPLSLPLPASERRWQLGFTQVEDYHTVAAAQHLQSLPDSRQSLQVQRVAVAGHEGVSRDLGEVGDVKDQRVVYLPRNVWSSLQDIFN